MMNNAKDFAAIWREGVSKTPTVEREFAGLPCIARRLSLMGWAQAGKLPHFLVEIMLKAKAGEDIEIKTSDIAPEEFTALMNSQRDIVCEVLEMPKVITEDRELADGEISYASLVMNRPDVVAEILTWVRAGCPDVPVATKNGKGTTVETVSNFRKGGKRRAASQPRNDVRAVPEVPAE